MQLDIFPSRSDSGHKKTHVKNTEADSWRKRFLDQIKRLVSPYDDKDADLVVPPIIHTLEIEGEQVSLGQPYVFNDGVASSIVVDVFDPNHRLIDQIDFWREGEWGRSHSKHKFTKEQLDEAVKLAIQHYPDPSYLLQ